MLFSELVYNSGTLVFSMGMKNEWGVFLYSIIVGSCCIDDGILIHFVMM